MLKELAQYLVENLVDSPDQVQIREKPAEGPQAVIIEIQVAEADAGKIIGKEGRIANALRTLLKTAASKHGQWVNIEIMNPPKSQPSV